MATKKDMRRPDLSKYIVGQMNVFLRPRNVLTIPASHPLPDARCEGGHERHERHDDQHFTNGRHVYAEQVRWLVCRSAAAGTLEILITGRASVVFAIQKWLGESAETRKVTSQPAYLSVGMSCEYYACPIGIYLPLLSSSIWMLT